MQIIKKKDYSSKLDLLLANQNKIISQNDELLFANLFRDSISDSAWLKNKSFSAYNAAANYSFLYKLYRILDVLKPKNILELGLGQTTKLTSQYAKYNKDSNVIAIDDDKVWIDVLSKQIPNSPNFKIKHLNLQNFVYKGDVLQQKSEYKDLEKVVKGKKFDLIIVDGPIGWDKEYPRTNVIGLLNNLTDTWVVIFDDSNRLGESKTTGIFRNELNDKNIKYKEFTTKGLKEQRYFCNTINYEILRNI